MQKRKMQGAGGREHGVRIQGLGESGRRQKTGAGLRAQVLAE